MVKSIERKKHTIDATGKAPGRLASGIAIILRGKNKSNFVPYLDQGDFVIIENVGKMKFTGKKLEQKEYFSHSTYPGHLKRRSVKAVFAENPGLVLQKAVKNMLPANKLRDGMMKRLVIK
ncbi:50S ribosomal protein L13 [Patescibacteria group bacterium]|nr:50S ribosomal protein L13 [Patescibacteria group bacterium]MBU4512919.1 50S ribosomal protein L13 [Patescibacteria group bacterium]